MEKIYFFRTKLKINNLWGKLFLKTIKKRWKTKFVGEMKFWAPILVDLCRR